MNQADHSHGIYKILKEKNRNLGAHRKPTYECNSSLIYHSKILEITHNPFNGGMANQSLVYPYTGTLLYNKKEQPVWTSRVHSEKGHSTHDMFHLYDILKVTKLYN